MKFQEKKYQILGDFYLENPNKEQNIIIERKDGKSHNNSKYWKNKCRSHLPLHFFGKSLQQ